MRTQTEAPGFWNDPQRAASISKELAALDEEIVLWEEMKREIAELTELAPMAGDDAALEKEIAARVADLQKRYEREEFRLFLSGKYDKLYAYVSLYSGAGGSDAQDWAEMLMRMYTRYFEKQGWEFLVEDVSRGEEAGIKEATIEVSAPYAFGFLKGEAGVHRLVRLSPFSSQQLRHTSFALVDVLPKIESVEGLDIGPDELRVDVFRASGPGGQNVNRRESAVRVTHLPTGISASSQSGRSQASNKEKALQLLRSKLYVIKRRNEEQELADVRGGVVSAEWGNQIRSYVLHPYHMVKDHRTGVETSDTGAVLDGGLDEFIQAEVRMHPERPA